MSQFARSLAQFSDGFEVENSEVAAQAMSLAGRPQFDYCALGEHLRSALALPELMSWRSAASADDRTRHGQVAPTAVYAPSIQLSLETCLPVPAAHEQTHIGPLISLLPQGDLWFNLPSGLTMRAQGGRQLSVQGISTRMNGAGLPLADARLFVLTVGMAMLAHQCRWWPLRAVAVGVEGRAVLLSGASTCGKSTLAMAFAHLGCPVWAEDVAVLSDDAVDGKPELRLGSSMLRMWPDAVRGLAGIGLMPKSVTPLPCRDDISKLVVPTNSLTSAADAPRHSAAEKAPDSRKRPVAAMIHLGESAVGRTGADSRCVRMDELSAANRLSASGAHSLLQLRQVRAAMDGEAALRTASAALAERIPMHLKMLRPTRYEQLIQTAANIINSVQRT